MRRLNAARSSRPLRGCGGRTRTRSVSCSHRRHGCLHARSAARSPPLRCTRGKRRAGCLWASVPAFVVARGSSRSARLLPRDGRHPLRACRGWTHSSGTAASLRCAPVPSLAAMLHNAPFTAPVCWPPLLYTKSRCIRRPTARGSRCAPVNTTLCKMAAGNVLCLVKVRRSRRRGCQHPARCASARRPWLARMPPRAGVHARLRARARAWRVIEWFAVVD